MARKYPTLVSKLVNHFDAWIVGGAATEENPKDYDIIVPFPMWSKAVQLIKPCDLIRINSLGGYKVMSEGNEVDIWPEDLTSALTSHGYKNLYHPRSNTLIRCERN